MNDQHTHTFLKTAARLMDTLEMLDGLHSAISDQQLESPSAQSQLEMIAWLQEIAFIAQEAAQELAGYTPSQAPEFRVIQGKGTSEYGGESRPETLGDSAETPFKVLVPADDPLPAMMQKASS